LGDLNIHGKIILREFVREDVGWIDLAENRDQWWPLVKAVMSHLVL
jgi:hypothetical protein